MKSASTLLLESPLFKHLDYDAAYVYRRDYRQYRSGYFKGARGEFTANENVNYEDNSSSVGGRGKTLMTLSPTFPANNVAGCSAKSTMEDLRLYGGSDAIRHMRPSPGTLDTAWNECTSSGSSSGVSESSNKMEEADRELFNIVSQWRLLYRNFRLGQARGAEGNLESLANRFSRSHLKVLPVVQLHDLLCNKPSPQDAASLHFGRINQYIAAGQLLPHYLHCHFGAGKLGLGLILPSIIDSQVPFVIWQRDSSVWKHLTSTNNNMFMAHVQLNFQTTIPLMVLLPSATLQDLATCFQQQYTRGVLMFVGDHSTERDTVVLQSARTFSCALGPAVDDILTPILSLLPPKDGQHSPNTDQRPYLLACENDHAKVDRLATNQALTNRIRVIPCMVDRICVDRHIGAPPPSWNNPPITSKTIDPLMEDNDHQPALIEVITEPFEGEIVILQQLHGLSPCPLGGPRVLSPSIDAQAKYYAQRKFLLVNGLHTTLAFLTFIEHSKNGTLKDIPGDYPLISYATASEELRRTMWGWAVARCLMLVWEHDSDVLKNAHDVQSDAELCRDILAYAYRTIRRFDEIKDSTKRVLSGGVDNRFTTRLENVEEFLNSNYPLSTPLGKEMLVQAGIGACELGYLIHQLVHQARYFTNQGGLINLLRTAASPVVVADPKRAPANGEHIASTENRGAPLGSSNLHSLNINDSLPVNNAQPQCGGTMC